LANLATGGLLHLKMAMKDWNCVVDRRQIG
jgi:hypothetical protein